MSYPIKVHLYKSLKPKDVIKGDIDPFGKWVVYTEEDAGAIKKSKCLGYYSGHICAIAFYLSDRIECSLRFENADYIDTYCCVSDYVSSSNKEVTVQLPKEVYKGNFPYYASYWFDLDGDSNIAVEQSQYHGCVKLVVKD